MLCGSLSVNYAYGKLQNTLVLISGMDSNGGRLNTSQSNNHASF